MAKERIPILTPIGILMTNRENVIKSVIGVLMARNLIMPIDYKYPEEYIMKMIQKTDTKFILCDDGTINMANNIRNLSNNSVKIINLNEILKTDNIPSKILLSINSYSGTDPIYVYFTSGTQGEPNAILGKGESLCHYIHWEIKQFEINYSVRIAQFTSPCHDPFLRDIFVPILTGGVICIPHEESIQNKRGLIEWINKSRVNLIHCTPSFFEGLLPPKSNFEDFAEMQYIFLAGEKVFSAMLQKWYKEFGDRIKIVNLYGPTETTLAKLYHIINPNKDIQNAVIPIGKPIDSTEVAILDSNLQPVGMNERGEIVIRTPYMTYGYLNNESLQCQKFVRNPFTKKTEDFLFRTGDYGYINEDDNVVFIERMDNQIKYMGYRIELDMIKNIVLKIPEVDNCVVIYKGEREYNFSQYIILYYVSSTNFSEDDIRVYLGKQLPAYMIPTYIVLLDEIPLTSNYKIDYPKLQLPPEVHEKPISKLEMELVKIWENILETKPIGVTDNFFVLGGHSLLLIKLEVELYKLGIEIEPNQLYKLQSVRELANYIEKLEGNKLEVCDGGSNSF